MKKAGLILSAVIILCAGCSGDVKQKGNPGKKSEGVMTFAEYDAVPLGSPVTVETFVQGKQSWWNNTATLYTQDLDGGYFIFEMKMSEAEYNRLSDGTKLSVSGLKSEWYGETEIIDAKYQIENDAVYVADPIDVTDLLGTDELVKKRNMRVSFKGMTVEAAGKDEAGNDVPFLYKWDGSGERGDDVYFNLSHEGKTFTFTIRRYLTDKDSDAYQAAEALKIGQTVDLEGFLYWYDGPNPHIYSIQLSE